MSTSRYNRMYKRGVKAELELVYLLWRHGWMVMRGPGSGKRLKKIFYPDVVAVKDGRVLLFEVKLRKHRDTIHIDEWKVEGYKELARRSSGECYVAVKVSDERKWFFFKLDTLEKQEHKGKTRYVITVNMYDKAIPLYLII